MDKIWLLCMIRVTDFDELADLLSLFGIQAHFSQSLHFSSKFQGVIERNWYLEYLDFIQS